MSSGRRAAQEVYEPRFSRPQRPQTFGQNAPFVSPPCDGRVPAKVQQLQQERVASKTRSAEKEQQLVPAQDPLIVVLSKVTKQEKEQTEASSTQGTRASSGRSSPSCFSGLQEALPILILKEVTEHEEEQTEVSSTDGTRASSGPSSPSASSSSGLQEDDGRSSGSTTFGSWKSMRLSSSTQVEEQAVADAEPEQHTALLEALAQEPEESAGSSTGSSDIGSPRESFGLNKEVVANLPSDKLTVSASGRVFVAWRVLTVMGVEVSRLETEKKELQDSLVSCREQLPRKTQVDAKHATFLRLERDRDQAQNDLVLRFVLTLWRETCRDAEGRRKQELESRSLKAEAEERQMVIDELRAKAAALERQQQQQLEEAAAELSKERMELRQVLLEDEEAMESQLAAVDVLLQQTAELTEKVKGLEKALSAQLKEAKHELAAVTEQAEEAITDANAAVDSLLQSTLPLAEKLKEREQAVQLERERHLQFRQEVGQFLGELVKELSASCTDPISLQPMQDPVLAADLHTYDRQTIQDWHKVNPISPHTRAPMEISTLRSNRAVLWIAEARDKLITALKKFWPDKAVVTAEAVQKVLPVPGENELLQALMDRDEDLAVELLARPMLSGCLNDFIIMKSGEWTVLQVALIRQLPRAATAIASRADFRRSQCFGNGMLAIHIAAAFGYEDVCCAILADAYDPVLLTIKTQRQISLNLATGGTLTVPAASTSWDLARNRKDAALLALFNRFTEGGPSAVRG